MSDYEYDSPDDDVTDDTTEDQLTVAEYFGEEAGAAVDETVKRIMRAAGLTVPDAPKGPSVAQAGADHNDQILNAILDGNRDEAVRLSAQGRQPLAAMGVVGDIPNVEKRVGMPDRAAQKAAADARYESAAAKARHIQDTQDRILEALHNGDREEAARISRKAYEANQRESGVLNGGRSLTSE